MNRNVPLVLVVAMVAACPDLHPHVEPAGSRPLAEAWPVAEGSPIDEAGLRPLQGTMDHPVDPPSSAPRGIHIIPLPRIPYLEELGEVALTAMAPGRTPDAIHPAGTVLVARTGPGAEDSMAITEWDLASHKALRSIALPLPPEDTDVTMVREGDRLHMMVWRPAGERFYVQVRTDLVVESLERVGRATRHGSGSIASDGALTIIADEMAPDGHKEAARPAVASFDRAGHRIAVRYLPDDVLLSGESAAVVGGKAFVLVAPSEPSVDRDVHSRILELKPDLDVARSIAVPSPPESDDLAGLYYPWLFASADHLVVTYEAPMKLVELDITGKELGRLPHCSAGIAGLPEYQGTPLKDVWLDDVHVALYSGGSVRAWLAWAEPGAAGPRPAAPCPGPSSFH